MKILIACECSGVFRRAFRDLGHDAWSCDLEPAEDGSPYHIQGDVLRVVGDGWDLMIAHPPCTRLTNAGVRWLHVPPRGKTLDQIRQELREGVEFYRRLRDAPIPEKAIENPIMHIYAREMLGSIRRHVVQHWHFGDPFFKATGWELHNLPPLVATNRLQPPKRGTEEHKRWSAVHRASPGPNRARERSRSFPGMAAAAAEQWGAALRAAA